MTFFQVAPFTYDNITIEFQEPNSVPVVDQYFTLNGGPVNPTAVPLENKYEFSDLQQCTQYLIRLRNDSTGELVYELTITTLAEDLGPCPQNNPVTNNNKLSAGAIVGIVFGVLFGLLLLNYLLYKK
jgi:hypothetical protein